MNRRLFYVADQALSSLTTFLVLSALARDGDLALVGRIALMQSVLLAAIGIGRAIGVDVWASRGAPQDESRAALRTSSSLYPIPVIIGLPVLILASSSAIPLFLFLCCTPLLLVNDSMRIVMMHRGLSHWSMGGQLIIVASLLLPTFASLGPVWITAVFLTSTVVVVAFNSILCRLVPGEIDLSYAKQFRDRAHPFAIESALGVVTQQIMFFIITAITSVSTAALIRLAQTTLGPLGILLSGAAPIVLRHFGILSRRSPADVLRRSVFIGTVLSTLLATGVGALLVLLAVTVRGESLLVILFGSVDASLFSIIAILGLGQSIGGLLLALGAAARVQGRTAAINRLRVLTIIVQAAILVATAPLASPLLSAAALASNSVLVLAVTVFVLNRRR